MAEIVWASLTEEMTVLDELVEAVWMLTGTSRIFSASIPGTRFQLKIRLRRRRLKHWK